MSRRNWLLIGIAVVVVGAAIGAIVASSGSGGGSSTVALSTQTSPVSVQGTPLPPLTDPSKDAAVGMTFPTISGQKLGNAGPLVIKPNAKAMVVLGIAHWCPHCQREVPLLAASIHSNPLPPSVEMFAISTSVQPSAPNYPPTTWLAKVSWPVPTLADDTKKTAADAIGLSSFPFFVFVDGSGKVVSRYTGEMPVEQFRATVNQLAGTVTAP